MYVRGTSQEMNVGEQRLVCGKVGSVVRVARRGEQRHDMKAMSYVKLRKTLMLETAVCFKAIFFCQVAQQRAGRASCVQEVGHRRATYTDVWCTHKRREGRLASCRRLLSTPRETRHTDNTCELKSMGRSAAPAAPRPHIPHRMDAARVSCTRVGPRVVSVPSEAVGVRGYSPAVRGYFAIRRRSDAGPTPVPRRSDARGAAHHHTLELDAYELDALYDWLRWARLQNEWAFTCAQQGANTIQSVCQI